MKNMFTCLLDMTYDVATILIFCTAYHFHLDYYNYNIMISMTSTNKQRNKNK